MWLGPKQDIGAVIEPLNAPKPVLEAPLTPNVVEVVKTVDRPIEIIKEIEVIKEVVKEVKVEVPVYVDRFIDRIVERIEEVPVIKEVRVEVPVEKVVKIPVHVNHTVTPKWVDFVFWGLIIKYAAIAVWLAVK